MKTDGSFSDSELEQEFQKLTSLETEKLMQVLSKLHNQNPTLFDQLASYAERRSFVHTMHRSAY
jgi:hypothetical protein